MRTGIGFPGYAADATYTRVSGPAFDVNYPLQNVSDLVNIQPPARAAAAGNPVFTCVFPGNRRLGFVAFLSHNLLAADALRVRLFSDTNPDPVGNAAHIVYDSGSLSFWPTGGPVASWPSVRPVQFTSVVARSVHFAVSIASGAVMELGGIELGQWWEWPGISPGKEMGLLDNSLANQLAGGAEAPQDVWMPRILNAEVTYWAMNTINPAGLDFQKGVDLQKPFVFCQDIDDPTSWPRTTMLCRNNELPPMVGQLYRHDAFQIRLVEHIR